MANIKFKIAGVWYSIPTIKGDKGDTGSIADLGGVIAGLPAKTTPVDADSLVISDSASANVEKKLTWVNVKATLKTYFDTIYNNYVHPANHPASIITQDANNRFVTDAEKITWNAKAPTTAVTTSTNGLMIAADKTKLDGIAESANNYTHPANHPASIITQDSSNRFVTDAEKSTWNAKLSSVPNASTQVSSLGVGTPASGTAGEIRATNNITAYYSDARLKDFLTTIDNPLKRVLRLNGYFFKENSVAKSLGYDNDRVQVGVSAQEVQEVLPEAVTDAPIGQGYLTVWYEKLVPLLIEAIKEQQAEMDEIKAYVKQLVERG